MSIINQIPVYFVNRTDNGYEIGITDLKYDTNKYIHKNSSWLLTDNAGNVVYKVDDSDTVLTSFILSELDDRKIYTLNATITFADKKTGEKTNYILNHFTFDIKFKTDGIRSDTVNNDYLYMMLKSYKTAEETVNELITETASLKVCCGLKDDDETTG